MSDKRRKISTRQTIHVYEEVLLGKDSMAETTARKGDLVQIHMTILAPEDRPVTLPEATRRVPYEGWIKGYLLDDEAEIGQTVRIESFIGRELSGTLVNINPTYNHNFGEPQPALDAIGPEAWKRLGRED